jgi:nucleotide-binding universal stress UspA family protein
LHRDARAGKAIAWLNGTMGDFNHILVPTDFTETSEHALEWAIQMASRLGSAITVMHAYELPIVGLPDATLVASAEIASRIADASRLALDKTIERHRDCGVPIAAVLREGAPWEEINRVADEIRADLVVLGTHGRKGIVRALLGSTAEKVVRSAHRAVATIHA